MRRFRSTDYSDIKNLDGEMPSMKDRDDADRRDGRGDRKDDELGLTPPEHDDLSALPAMPGHVEQIRGLPEKNLSLDM